MAAAYYWIFIKTMLQKSNSVKFYKFAVLNLVLRNELSIKIKHCWGIFTQPKIFGEFYKIFKHAIMSAKFQTVKRKNHFFSQIMSSIPQ